MYIYIRSKQEKENRMGARLHTQSTAQVYRFRFPFLV
jgi:hypothetical protein